ncbi:MAG: hypothetical protein EZS28_041949 [Streblomastix strix]|uniref:Nicotinamide N-methyltransferase n=1 Tax=Streblomastix strix TaxID=222440 RepID=A0A5J4TW53_9EUKA|nr:MAG: hypothetical protein EZS28_041949 [Streblomastix strix]
MADVHANLQEIQSLRLLSQEDIEHMKEEEGKINTISSIIISGMQIIFQHAPQLGLSFQVWPSCIALARYISTISRDTIQNKNILELGSATGVLSSYMAKLGGNIIASDLPKTIPFLQETLNRNQINTHKLDEEDSNVGCAIAYPLDWTNPPFRSEILHLFSSLQCSSDKLNQEQIDFIVGTDCVYDRQFHDPLMKCLLSLCGIETQVWLCNVKRFKTDNKFWNKLNKYFEIEQV